MLGKLRIAYAALPVTASLVLGLGAAAPSSHAAQAGTCLDETPTIVGTDGADTLRGTTGDDVIDGLGGNDTIDGGGGNDTVCGGAGDDAITTGEGLVVEISGGDGNDTISTGDAINFIGADAGDDRTDGSAKSLNLVSYAEAPGPVTVDLAAGTATGWGADTLHHVLVVLGSAFADSLSGDDEDNALLGRGGNDKILGRGGNDFLTGDAGNDALDGGPGLDTALFDGAPRGIRASLASGNATGWGTDRLVGIEQLSGSDHADVLVGDARPNVISGGRGNDSLFGGARRDRLYGQRGRDTADGGPGRDYCSAEKRVRCP